MMNEPTESEVDIQIRKNIASTYALKLQDITRHMRSMEKKHLQRFKDFYGEEGETVL